MRAYGISQQIQKQYNCHPYPGYPLFVPLRWQDGYMGASIFSRRLCADLVGISTHATKSSQRPLLVAGCGDTQLAILRKVELAAQPMIGIDISSRNIRRTRLRMWRALRQYKCHTADLDAYLAGCANESFSHLDAYGVLHHLSDPSATLGEMARCLQTGGTARFMVYNTPARRWIHGIQHLFRGLGLSFHRPVDVAVAQKFLRTWCTVSPALREKCQAMGPSLLAHRGRFVDTFLHVREARLSPTQWVQRIKEVGLTPVGLLDRYGEWDTHPNPLWQLPTEQALEQQANCGAFENNLELFVCKQPLSTISLPPSAFHTSLSLLHLRPPPVIWFSFPETNSIPFWQRFSLWWGYINYIYSGKMPQQDLRLPPSAAQRLARLGAILPGMVRPAWREILAAPMEAEMPVYTNEDYPKKGLPKMSEDDMHFLLDKAAVILRNQKNVTPRHQAYVHARIKAVQLLVEKEDSP